MIHRALVLAASLIVSPMAGADVGHRLERQGQRTGRRSRIGTPPAVRIMAIVHTAVYEAANAVTKRYPAGRAQARRRAGGIARCRRRRGQPRHAAEAAAVAAAGHRQRLPGRAGEDCRRPGQDGGHRRRREGRCRRAGRGRRGQGQHRRGLPAAHHPGVYVPTVVPAVPQWAQRKPWVLSSPAQFRPGPPPPLNSELWARDYNEIKAIGGKNSTQPHGRADRDRQLLGLFDAADLPRRGALGGQPARARADTERAPVHGRDPGQRRRAHRHHGGQVPLQLLAPGDGHPQWRCDGNDATERDASWTPFIDTPMHPEYPCAHCVIAGRRGHGAAGRDRQPHRCRC